MLNAERQPIPLAEADVIDAWEWYEAQSAGLRDRFVSAAEAAVQRATRWPNAGMPALDRLLTSSW